MCVADVGIASSPATSEVVDPEKVVFMRSGAEPGGLEGSVGSESVCHADQAVQKNAPESSEELLEIHGGSSQNRIDRISGNTLQPIALQAVFILQMSDAGFYRSAAFHPSPEWVWCSASLPLIDVHYRRTFIIMAAITHIHMHLADRVTDHPFHLLHLCRQRVAVVGTSRKA